MFNSLVERYKSMVKTAMGYAEAELKASKAPTSTFEQMVIHFRDFIPEIERMEEKIKTFKRVPEQAWRDISTAPIPAKNAVDQGWIKGLTTHGKVVACRYLPQVEGEDRWGHDNVRYNLTHWKPLDDGDRP